MEAETKEVFKKIFNKKEIKSRLPFALLAGFTFSFMFFFFGVLEIYAANRDEFMFSVSDFIWPITGIAFAVAAVLSALILFLPKTASNIVFGLLVWVTFMGYIQVLLLNGSGSLMGDTGQKQSTALIVVDTVIWAVTGVAIIAGTLIMESKEWLKRVYLIGIIVIFVMQTAGCASQIGKITQSVPIGPADPDDAEQTQSEAKEELEKNAYLSYRDIDKVSKGKNTVIFIVDRFDVSYYKDIKRQEPGFFDRLDGFTYFSDNISLYSRTWPAVATMITGVDNNFIDTQSEYFEKAYPSSPFLKDLKDNDYRIKLYITKNYSYSDGTPLVGIADNLSYAGGYTIPDTFALVRKLFALSAYRYLPNLCKGAINISTASFNRVVKLNGDDPLYEADDPTTCGQILQNGLDFDSEQDSYIMIHFNGCHSPYNMDADGNRLDGEKNKSEYALDQLRGCFKTIFFYIEEMKRLGVYDDSTIVITGDHPRARDDALVPSQPRITALFVKPAGASGGLKYSSAQVSQANLIPTIIKSAGINTENDYGLSYFEIPEGTDTVRYHKFELYGEPSKIITFKINGAGEDFNNWKIESEFELPGSIYR